MNSTPAKHSSCYTSGIAGNPDRHESHSHRVYADRDLSCPNLLTVSCRVADIPTICELAEAADRVEIRHAAVKSRRQKSATKKIIDAIDGLRSSPKTGDAAAFRRRLRWLIADQMARLEIKGGHHILVGAAAIPNGKQEAVLLLIVFANLAVRSCDWRMAV
jgi:hypothetical protein